MARVAAVPIYAAGKAGANVTAEIDGDPVNGHSVPNSGKTMILVRNSSATPYDFTVTVKGAVAGLTPDPYVVEIGNMASRLFGPYETADFGTSLFVDVENAALKFRVIEPR